MTQAPLRVGVRGSTFVRQVARMAKVDATPPGGSLPDRLSQWLSWTQSIALSSALDGQPSPAPDGTPVFGPGEDAECSRVRASLVETIKDADAWSRARQRAIARAGAVAGDPDTRVEYSALRERYLMTQRSVQAATGKLRGQLRDMLANRSPAMARLAEVDAVMEGALSPREQRLLGGVPGLLEARFEQARQVAAEAPGTQGVWLDLFIQDMQDVLLAELDVRFQPLEGLLAALRSP